MLSRLVAGKLDELTLRKERYCCLPPPTSHPAQRAAASLRIDCSANVSLRDQRSGLCLPDSLRTSGKESQRGALAYRKTCGYCHVEVGCGGTLHSEIHSTVAQAMHRTCSHRAGLVERQQVGRAGETEAKTIESGFPCWGAWCVRRVCTVPIWPLLPQSPGTLSQSPAPASCATTSFCV